ncbi:RNA polymerase sigma-70 factor, ECF subfamily [Sphingobacterium nematocida]|uniref:RNA polymerase sigma-70 factor, ECF subfamily n=2 Tax=Sphingobacterium nematocida TaxID=1513896 RepID=A0A1T5FM33_9SPHI|nr:RNA polymerase sigma-70 factor, ECF subfamily [Sphingobacterium nematocida]
MANFGKHSMSKNMSEHDAITPVAFQELFLVWNRKIYHYALSKTASTYIAEETVQRVFIKLWNNLYHKKLDIKIETQLFCIAKSVLLDIVKEERRRRTHTLESDLPISYDHTPLEVYRVKELEQHLEHVINRMPKARRTIFRMSRFENLSYKEIAQQLSISPKTVENHISLALQTLRRAFYHFLTLLIIIFIFF